MAAQQQLMEHGNLRMFLDDLGGQLSYTVLLNAVPVIHTSSLGFIRSDGNFFDELHLTECEQEEEAQEYGMLVGKARHIRTVYDTWRCTIEASSQHFILEVALSDRLLAFRYHMPADGSGGPRTMLEERTTFNIVKSAGDYQIAQPYDAAKSEYQRFYQPRTNRTLASIGDPLRSVSSPDGFSLPALFKSGDNWIMLKESGLDGNYPASHIKEISEHGIIELDFPAQENGNGAMGSRLPSHTLPWTTPWRILTMSTAMDDLIADTSVTDLAAPSLVRDMSWIKPGSASWSWYANASNTMSYEATKAYVDLAASRSWPYSLLDAGWDRMTDSNGRHVTLEEISTYAQSKSVRLWVWMNSAGPNNNAYDVTPRDMLFDPDVRRQTMKWLQGLNVAGIKVDGIESEKQDMIQYLSDVLTDAADHHLMIVLHNCPVPHGWERTWPNLISSEGLVTSEYYTSSKIAYAPQIPENNVNEAFLRLTIGPADYAPGTFSQTVYPFDAPLTTQAHEAAMHVIADSGLRCFPESPETYAIQPAAEVMALLNMIPFVWDETHFIDGEPGKYFVVAKRSGKDIYIAGINGETVGIAGSLQNRTAVGKSRRIELDTARFAPEVDVVAAVFDEVNTGSRVANTHASAIFSYRGYTELRVTMEPFGGFVVVLRVVEKDSAPLLGAVASSWSLIWLFLVVLPMLTIVVMMLRGGLWRKSKSARMCQD